MGVTENVNGLRHPPLIKQQHRLIDTLMHQQNMFFEQLMSTTASQQRIIEDFLYSKVDRYNVDRHKKSRNVGSHVHSAGIEEAVGDVKASYYEQELEGSSRQSFERNFFGNDVFERELFDEYSFGMSFSTLMFCVLAFHVVIIFLAWSNFYSNEPPLADGSWFSWTHKANTKELDAKKKLF